MVATATVLGIRRADVAVPDRRSDGRRRPRPTPSVDAARGTSRVDVDDYDAFHNVGRRAPLRAGHVRSSRARPPTGSAWRCRWSTTSRPRPLQRVLAAADFGNGVSRLADFEELAVHQPRPHGAPAPAAGGGVGVPRGRVRAGGPRRGPGPERAVGRGRARSAARCSRCWSKPGAERPAGVSSPAGRRPACARPR